MTSRRLGGSLLFILVAASVSAQAPDKKAPVSRVVRVTPAEATNAVDNLTEAAIRQTLEALSGRVTTIIVAHRLSSTRQADRIVVLNDGRIVEVGRRAELLERRGPFAELLKMETG